MKSNYKKLGKYIQQIDIRNIESKEENLLGVSVKKRFIPSIANTVGTDFSKYKVVQKGQFTYIPDTSRRGDKIGIALLEDYDEGLVSNVYTVFEIIDEKVLIPQYLMLWFSRPEFDRFSRFKSHGSVREVFDWDEMCDVELPVPDYEEQLCIVNNYKAISDRIALKRQINDNLCECLLRQSRQYNLLKFKQFLLFQLVFSNLLNGRLRKLNKFIKAFFVRDYNLVHKDMRFVSTRHFGSCCSRHNIVKETILGQCTVDQFLISNVICPNYQDISITSPKFVTMKNFLEIWTNVAY
ncbi:restriction endonuclease subunit S [Sedimentibacter saalensis]|uniref:restriction endonuclease subunit S n=1 Tax=Sedimentibacter saalensis TaxID=130788 RepID=UPI00289910EB|nr:hypothetical protein [Sedimentibacter saalensis]